MHLLANVVMETAIINSWNLTESMKKEILLNAEGTPWKLNELVGCLLGPWQSKRAISISQ